MTEVLKSEYAPDYVSPPGETLEEVLAERGMSQAELAGRTGRPKKTINEIVQGKTAITPETALQLELVLGIPTAFWNTREVQYREFLARKWEHEDLATQVEWLSAIPHREMAKLRWIPSRRRRVEQLQEVLRFFGVASVESWHALWDTQQSAFRQSRQFSISHGAVAAWLRKGELQAQEVRAAQFDAAGFKDALREVRSLTRRPPDDFEERMVGLCADVGVALVFVHDLPKTRAWGATRWLGSGRALIQLGLRYKTDHHFWFTFFHEAGHLLLHGKRDVFVETEGAELDEKENEANRFAATWLIPEAPFRAFRRRGACSEVSVRRFAHEIGIAPGIVVGRLQHEGVIGQNQLNHLKRKLEWTTD